MSPIVLLRERKDDDEYESLLKDHGYHTEFVQLLVTEFNHTEELFKILQNPDGYSGFIATSQKVADAIKQVLEDLGNGIFIRSKWSAKCVYCVGPSTSKAMNDLGFKTEGGFSGNAAALAEFIIEHHQGESLPLVFLTGDKTGRVIPNKLYTAGISIIEQQVYTTRNVSQILDIQSKIVVLFSPSGLISLEWNGHGRWIAIGPTTSNALTEKGVEHVVATSPSPMGVLQAIQKCGYFSI
ncbi:hypothetical protein HDV02_005609 [Globomyces sp. JEL0801]|nr:hypothetical protein HDV02_005609 [Globomyces sp. JEL0801]